MIIVYHPFVPIVRPLDQVECWRTLQRLAGCDILHYMCEDLFDYHVGLMKAWDSDGDLIIVEHDMAPTPKQIIDMANCKEEICTRPYWIGPATSGRTDATISITTEVGRPNREVPYAIHSAIGLVKISGSLRKRLPKPNRNVWFSVEGEINKIVQQAGLQWHCHYPLVAHNHGRFNNERRESEQPPFAYTTRASV